ncbi:MAG TPA: EAL domain-containing protein [Dehalococcoidia bacterium]|nr:EAL domain-containing protein [Dehalococcoidia bacterium]
MLERLQELARIAATQEADIAAVERACGVVAAILDAEEAYVLRSGDPHFVRLGCACNPTTYEIKQKGYWLIWRDAVTHPEYAAGMFDARDRLIGAARPIAPGVARTHLAARLPGDEGDSGLLVVRGPWARGLSAEQVRAVEVVRPILAQLVRGVLDGEHRSRQRAQLEALADVSRAFNDAGAAEDVLDALATALAKASGFDWINIVMYNDACDAVVARSMNTARHSSTDTAAVFREGRGLRERDEIAMGVELVRRGANVLLPDVFAPGLESVPNAELIGDALPFLQKYWERGHVLSIAMLPIVFQGRALGMVHFSSSTQRAFGVPEVEFLAALVSQAATAIKGLQLYRDLQQSREDLRWSEERFRSLVQNASDLVTIVDAEGTLRYSSPSVERLMGYRPDEWWGRSALTLVHPDDIERAVTSLRLVADEPGVHPPTVLRLKHGDGSWRYLEMTANNLLDVPSVAGIVYNARDITERWDAEQALRESEERFRSLVQHASDLITVIDVDTTVMYQSPSMRRVLGHEAEKMIGTRLAALMHPDDVPRIVAMLGEVMSKAGSVVLGEVRARHADGSWRQIELSSTDQRSNPGIRGIVLNSRDVTERKLLEEQLRHQALHDPLTQLANRTRFTDRLEHGLLRAARMETRVAVLFMDLDNFKGVNDSLGHSAGDRLLTEVAERVQACLRPSDTIARLGGDEFAVLLEDVVDAEDATTVAQRIFDTLRAPFALEGKELTVRASIGIAVSETRGADAKAEALLRDADVAMYVAKSHGKGRYEVFEPDMQIAMVERLALLSDLQRAFERDEYVVHYQPMVLLRSGQLIGVEALVRWRHPTRGLLPPGDFIPLAEESGVILELGLWVLREACRQAAAWQAMYACDPPWTISVNVSVKQLQHPSFVADVAEVLRTSGIDPRTLVLEITESVMMQDAVATMDLLGRIKSLGVRLAIDDFGTGYSSLSYLRQFPFDLLKIDKSFIDDVGAPVQHKELTKAIIELGKTLDLELVAEGIERPEQLSRLQTLDCELGQGFYFAEPLEAAEVEELLRGTRARPDAAA